MQPPKAEGPSTSGRHRPVPAEAATAASPDRLARSRERLAAFSAQPPRALHWGLLGAALVILVAVPIITLSGGEDHPRDTIADTTAAEQLDAEPTARMGLNGATRSTRPGLPPTSAAPATDTVPQSPAAADPAADSGTAGNAGASAAASGRSTGSGTATSQAPAAGMPAGSSSSAATSPATTQQPAPPTKTCLIDLMGLCI